MPASSVRSTKTKFSPAAGAAASIRREPEADRMHQRGAPRAGPRERASGIVADRGGFREPPPNRSSLVGPPEQRQGGGEVVEGLTVAGVRRQRGLEGGDGALRATRLEFKPPESHQRRG